MGAIASLDYTKEERQRLAKKSLDFECPECGKIACLLQEPDSLSTNENNAVQEEARALAAQVTMKGESNNEIQSQEPVIPDALVAPVIPEQIVFQQPELRQSTNNSDATYNYIIAAIIVALAILLFRRFALPALA